MAAKTQRERFDELRAAYIKQRDRRSETEDSLRRKYGIGYAGTLHDHWLTSPERKKRESADQAADKARRKLFDFIQSISPRDWSSGVPYHWICDDLTFEDAVRPKDETLSVTPPLAYGCTQPMR